MVIDEFDHWLDVMASLLRVADFSCGIEVSNSSKEDYELLSFDKPPGHYLASPPQTIATGKSAKIWIQDNLGPAGSEGSAVYKGKTTGQEVSLVFLCTTVGGPNDSNANLCSGTNEFYSKSDKVSNDWLGKNIVQESGHPFFAKFVIQENNGNEFTKQDDNTLIAKNGTSLKLGESVTVNGSTDLSSVLTDKDDSKVFSIKLNKSSDPLYAYVITVDGQGPDAGWDPTKAGETLVLKFYNKKEEIDFLTLYDSDRKEHTMRYSSDAPYVTKITWEVKGDLEPAILSKYLSSLVLTCLALR